MNRLTILAVSAVAILGGAYLWQSNQPVNTTSSLTNFGMAEAQTAEEKPVDKSLVAEMVLGAEDAPVTVIEYASFTCPHCANFHDTVFSDLKADYVDTGKIRFVFREVYFDRFGLWAGMVARCGTDPENTDTAADSKRYFAISDLIFDQQKTWVKGENAGEIADNLVTIGKTAGLTGDQLDSCLQNGDMARALIAVYQENSERDGINSTPSFMIDGEKYSNMAYDKFKEVLNEKLGE